MSADLHAANTRASLDSDPVTHDSNDERECIKTCNSKGFYQQCLYMRSLIKETGSVTMNIFRKVFFSF